MNSNNAVHKHSQQKIRSSNDKELRREKYAKKKKSEYRHFSRRN